MQRHTVHHLIARNHEFWNHERSLTALLIYVGLSVLLWISLGDYNREWWAFIIDDTLYNLILLAGVFTVFTEWRRQILFIMLALAAGTLKLLLFFNDSNILAVASQLLTCIFLGLLARRVLSHIFKDGPMTFYRIQGSIVIFLIVGIIYAGLYMLAEMWFPGSLMLTPGSKVIHDQFSQLLYFSFVTMTTLGIGDMIPVTPMAKALAVTQGIVGLLYPVIMIARLVSMEVTHSTHIKK